MSLFGLSAMAQTWTNLANDVAGDGANPDYLDGTSFSYWYDDQADSIYFQIEVQTVSTAHLADFGVNILFNVPGMSQTFNFWGNDNQNPYHLLLSMWVTGTPPDNYSGVIGIADASGVQSSNWTNYLQNGIAGLISANNNTITLAMRRADLIDEALIPLTGIDIGVAAAVGSSSIWNDDIYTPGATMNITLDETSGILEQTAVQQFSVFPNPTTDFITLDQPDVMGYTLFSLSGQQMKVENGNNLRTVDLTHVPSGMYILEVRNRAGMRSQARVVKR